MSQNIAFLGFVEDVVARWRSHRESVRTRNIVAGLSPQMRKDIGWPDSLPDRARRRLSHDGSPF
ncbi:hypothetical protein [Mesorhizobium sp. CAU 1741]|uniref:hypothetical protein n=1 Tax=Mesorhizobium sp. CAU 1741 TaxID=3140366 RepID=UPI00325A759E